MVPVVVGASRENYERVAPSNSFIYAEDFEDTEELANYLKKVGENDDLYNQYFTWVETGELVNTYPICRLCALLHSPAPPRHYDNIQMWWEEACM